MQVGMNPDAAGGPSVFDLPKLDPKMLNERARIWIPDPGSIRLQYVHALGGKKAQLPGQPEPGWGGNWLCTGRDEVLKNANPMLDPDACFMCREHANGNNLVGKAQRKFIVQVLRYNTDPAGNLLQPFGAVLLVWQFSDKQYRSLTEVQTSWGDIRERDLMLVCDNIGFKSWTLQPLPEVAFMRDPSWIQLVTQVVQSQAATGEDLERILGRAATNDQEIMAKLAEITPASMAPAVAYQAPPIPGMPPGMPMAPPAMAPAGPPPMVPPAQAAYAQAPPAEALYPPGGPFDQAQQTMPQAPGMVPPAMPPTPPPAQAATPPLPAVPDMPQVPGQQLAPPPAAPPAPMPPAPQVPGIPDLTQPPPAPAAPAAPQAPAMPLPQAAPAPAAAPVAPPPMVPPAPQTQPGAPAQPAPATDLGALMAAPPPPPAPPA